jgi:hypothetical protein
MKDKQSSSCEYNACYCCGAASKMWPLDFALTKRIVLLSFVGAIIVDIVDRRFIALRLIVRFYCP